MTVEPSYYINHAIKAGCQLKSKTTMFVGQHSTTE